MTAGQVPVLGLWGERRRQLVAEVVAQADAVTMGLMLASLFMSGEIEPSISLTPEVAWALPQPLTRT